MVDEFVLYDDAQYTKRDWRNRNKIKMSNGLKWLTIPVEVKGRFEQKIKDTLIADKKWAKKHWEAIFHSYSKAEYFNEYKEIFERLYLTLDENYLSQVNCKFIKNINQILNIETKISWSGDYPTAKGRNENLITICKSARADKYLSGPAARKYIDESLFSEEGIEVKWIDYLDYPEYRQLFPPFEHEVSFLDLLFNEGPNAKSFMKSF